MDPLIKEIEALREKVAALTEDRKEGLAAMNSWVRKAEELEQKLASIDRYLRLQRHLADAYAREKVLIEHTNHRDLHDTWALHSDLLDFARIDVEAQVIRKFISQLK